MLTSFPQQSFELGKGRLRVSNFLKYIKLLNKGMCELGIVFSFKLQDPKSTHRLGCVPEKRSALHVGSSGLVTVQGQQGVGPFQLCPPWGALLLRAQRGCRSSTHHIYSTGTSKVAGWKKGGGKGVFALSGSCLRSVSPRSRLWAKGLAGSDEGSVSRGDQSESENMRVRKGKEPPRGVCYGLWNKNHTLVLVPP